ncbi:hypothetical protein Ancab_037543 [Ancistrocladus abbreviatus]
MVFPCCSNMFRFHVVIVSILIALLGPSHGLQECHFPAIFNFGDSNSDTGGFSASYYQHPSPYGETFFHMPAGRASDGRLIVDFMAESLGLPYLSAYLNSLGSNFSHGANFAYDASTITPQSLGLSDGGYSPFYLLIQYGQFKQFMSRSQMLLKQGGIYEDLVPVEKFFGRALYTVDMGQNDLAAGFYGNKSIEQVNASVPSMIDTFAADIKDIYNLGARSFWIHSTGPIGCLTYILVGLSVSQDQMDSVGCAKPYNDVAQYFNQELKRAVSQLRQELPLASFTYVDVYSVKYSLFSQPQKYGFEQPLLTCCGYGGKYNFNGDVRCGQTGKINGTQIYVGSCKNPQLRVIWDGVHYTEAANKIVFDQISSGAFSDPRLPLKFACNRI